MGNDFESRLEATLLCVICCKTSIKAADKRPCLDLLFEHLRLEPEVGKDFLGTCGDCSFLLKEYGDLFEDWKALELELERRIKEIANIVRCASQVTRRREAFKTWCDNLGNSDQDKMGTDLKQLRSKLRRQCKKIVTEALPKVQLAWVHQEEGPPGSNKTMPESLLVAQVPGIDKENTTSTDTIPTGNRDTTVDPFPRPPLTQINQQSTSDNAIIPGSSDDKLVVEKSGVRESIPVTSISDPVVSSTSQPELAPIQCPTDKSTSENNSPVQMPESTRECENVLTGSPRDDHQSKALCVGWLSSLVAITVLSDFTPTPGNTVPDDVPVDDFLEITPVISSVQSLVVPATSSDAPAQNVRKECPVCKVDFSTPSNMKRHLRHYHNDDQPDATSSRNLKLASSCIKRSTGSRNNFRRHIWKKHIRSPINGIVHTERRRRGRPRKHFVSTAVQGQQKLNVPQWKRGRGRPRKHFGVHLSPGSVQKQVETIPQMKEPHLDADSTGNSDTITDSMPSIDQEATTSNLDSAGSQERILTLLEIKSETENLEDVDVPAQETLEITPVVNSIPSRSVSCLINSSQVKWPKKQCPICKVAVSTKNLARHIKNRYGVNSNQSLKGSSNKSRWTTSRIPPRAVADLNPEGIPENAPLKEVSVEDRLQITPPRTPTEISGKENCSLPPKRIMYKCYKCSDLFSSKSNLRRHMRRKHEGCPVKMIIQSGRPRRNYALGRFSCNLCHKIYAWRKTLLRHYRMRHSSSGNVETGSGNIAILVKTEAHTTDPAEEPETTSSGIIPAAVEATNSSSLEESTLQVVKSEDVRNAQCEGGPSQKITAKGNKSRGKLSGPQLFQCQKCGRRFGEKWNLQRHIKNKSCRYAAREALIQLNAELDFKCKFCNKDLKERGTLEDHVAGRHRFVHEKSWEYKHLDIDKGQAAGIFFCPFCGLKEASREAMKNHFRKEHFEMFGVPKSTPDNVS